MLQGRCYMEVMQAPTRVPEQHAAANASGIGAVPQHLHILGMSALPDTVVMDIPALTLCPFDVIDGHSSVSLGLSATKAFTSPII